MGSKTQLRRSIHHIEDYHRLKFHHDRRSFHHQIDGNTRRKTSLHLLCAASPFLSFFSFSFASRHATTHLYIYILNNFENSMHVLSLNKLKLLFLNSPSVIMNYTQLMIFHLTKNTIVFII